MLYILPGELLGIYEFKFPYVYSDHKKLIFSDYLIYYFNIY
jgi:hypothetical protein